MKTAIKEIKQFIFVTIIVSLMIFAKGIIIIKS